MVTFRVGSPCPDSDNESFEGECPNAGLSLQSISTHWRFGRTLLSKRFLLIGVVTLTGLTMIRSASPATIQTIRPVNDMSSATIQGQMTSGQQVQLLHIVDLGLKWAAGQISFKDVRQRLGKPKLISNEEGASEIECMYFPDGMAIDFVFSKLRLRNGNPEESYFRLSVSESVHTNIRKETLDNLGLYRIGSRD